MIVHGDLFDVLPTLEAESIDACVTDPPYGLGFMGKQWDTFKPGVAETRIVENKQRESDNPNLKGRKRGPASSPSAVEYDRSLRGQHEFQSWTEAWAREVLRVLKPGAYLLVCGAPRSYHRMASGLEDAGFEIRDCFSWLFGQGFPKSLNVGHGRGTALKPANEPIVVARKPFKGSLLANLAKHGTGALNIDACRIEGATGDGHWSRDDGSDRTSQPGYDGGFTTGGQQNTLGRWPANVVLDEDAADLLDEQSGELTSGARTKETVHAFDPHAVLGGRATRRGGICEASNGGASRFFYVAKPSREERDAGIYDLPLRQGSLGHKRCAKCGRQAVNVRGTCQCDEPEWVGGGDVLKARNHHPTVKPVELMRWLVKLVTPPNGAVLDPFCGSGTTGMACAYEFREFIGIEREAEYVEIAKRRIASCAPLFTESEAGS